MFAERIPDIPGVPHPLIALLRRGMANEPAHRPSASALRDALAGIEPGFDPPASADRDPDPTMVLRPVSPFITSAPPPARPPSQRSAQDDEPTVQAGVDPTRPPLPDATVTHLPGVETGPYHGEQPTMMHTMTVRLRPPIPPS